MLFLQLWEAQASGGSTYPGRGSVVKRFGRGGPWHGGVAAAPTAGGRTGARAACRLSGGALEGGQGIIIRGRGRAAQRQWHAPSPPPGADRAAGEGGGWVASEGTQGGGQGCPPPPPASPQSGPRSVTAGKRPVQAGLRGVSTPNKAKRSRGRAGGTGKTSTPGPG